MRSIIADVTKVKGTFCKVFNECVGSGRAYEGLVAEHQRQLKIVHDECGFKYLRFHGLLHDDMGVYTEDKDGNPIYNWQYIDLLYDYILSIGMKPFVELSFMPTPLAAGTKTVFFWKGNISLPKSFEKWAALIKELTIHWTQRYGSDELKQWYFEVWNEPDLKNGFFDGEMTDYYKLYDVTAQAIKAVCPEYRVGGPATAHGWVKEFIDACVASKSPVDFVSTHCYGVDGFLDQYNTFQLTLKTDPNVINDYIKEVRDIVNASPLPHLEIHLTEWSTSFTPRDPVHDSYHSAAYILSKIKNSQRHLDSMSYWVFSDIFEENGPGPTHFHGGFGLCNIQGIKKPSFFAYKYLNRLGGTELDCADPDAWACKDDTSVQVLFWNFKVVKQDCVNQIFYKRDLPAGPAGKINVALSGLTAGTYQMSLYGIGYKMNDVYTSYLDLHCRGTLTKEQIYMLNACANGLPISQKTVTVTADGLYSYTSDIRENDVYMIVLEQMI